MAAAAQGQSEPGLTEWKPLFDGKSLDGWTQRGGKASYKVEDGAIVGTTAPGTPNSFLCTERDYGDFILEFDVKVDPSLNSGVQFRSSSRPDYKEGRVHGYQAEIDPSPRGWSGGIYDEGRRGWLADLKESPHARTAFKNGEWNRYRIVALGDQFQVSVNGIPTASLRDDMTRSGFIALQVHSTTSTEPLQVAWKDIRIREAEPGKLRNWPADPRMGDWQGTLAPTSSPIVAQVISLGDGKYQANLLPAFDTRGEKLGVLEGTASGAQVRFTSADWEGEITGEKFAGRRKGDNASFEMRKVSRPSPTQGQAPPEGAVILFDGKDLSKWTALSGKPAAWKLVDGTMEVVPKAESVKSTEQFGDATYHIEFQTPFMPGERGQKRGNSGVYLNGVYEIQVLDSYGLEGAENECGGLYKAAAPRVNMCAPPLQWQTFDIDLTAPRYDDSGKKVANARATVKHNGVVIHDNVELPGATPGGVAKEERNQPGPLMLQDHGDPVRFRNIWVVPSAKK